MFGRFYEAVGLTVVVVVEIVVVLDLAPVCVVIRHIAFTCRCH